MVLEKLRSSRCRFRTPPKRIGPKDTHEERWLLDGVTRSFPSRLRVRRPTGRGQAKQGHTPKPRLHANMFVTFRGASGEVKCHLLSGQVPGGQHSVLPPLAAAEGQKRRNLLLPQEAAAAVLPHLW